jgi:hypothetical protein
MSKKTIRTFSQECLLETAQLVIDQGYTHDESAKVMGVGLQPLENEWNSFNNNVKLYVLSNPQWRQNSLRLGSKEA